MLNRYHAVWLFSLLLFVQPVVAQIEPPPNPDPWEGWNRKVNKFNDFADRYVLKPVAKAYQAVTPEFVDVSVTNFFHNLREPITIVNDVFQLKLMQAGADSSRFLINSSLGLVGLFDVASGLGLPRNQEDFGQSLGYWGVGPGPYVELPFLGPSNVRDAFGMVPDIYTYPLLYVDEVSTRYVATSLRVTDLRADLLEAEGLITGDRYIFLRDSFLQRREALVRDGAVQDDFGEEDF